MTPTATDRNERGRPASRPGRSGHLDVGTTGEEAGTTEAVDLLADILGAKVITS